MDWLYFTINALFALLAILVAVVVMLSSYPRNAEDYLSGHKMTWRLSRLVRVSTNSNQDQTARNGLPENKLSALSETRSSKFTGQ